MRGSLHNISQYDLKSITSRYDFHISDDEISIKIIWRINRVLSVIIVRFFYFRQKCCGSRRLTGGASKSEMTPINKSSSLERPLKREAGGGCQCCAHPSTCCNSSNADCSSTASSCCPSQCRYSQVSSRQPPDYQSCTSSTAPKSIWKKRICCQCNTSHCLCQPMSRGCNCPPPIQVDVRAARECSCDCSSSPECACPSGEQRFPKTTIKCPNVRLCCPFSRLSPSLKCHCARCQSCPPPVCHPCTITKCRGSIPPKDSCYSRLPTSYSPCRPASAASSHLPTPRKKLTFCTERGSRPSSPCTGTGQSLHGCIAGDKNSENSIYKDRNDIEERENDMKDCADLCDCCCATESENGSDHVDESCDLILEERSELESLTSNVLINSETTKPSKSVDPDLFDMPEGKGKFALENATKIFERYTIEKSWHTLPIYFVPFNNSARFDCYTFRGEHLPVGKNISGNSALLRFSNHMKSPTRIKRQNLSTPNKLLSRQAVAFRDISRAHVGSLVVSVSIPTTPTCGIDRRRREW